MFHRANTVVVAAVFSVVTVFLVILAMVVANPMHLYSNARLEEIDQVEFSLPEGAKKVDKTEILCMAKNIYYEARGESLVGKLAVGHVVLNRLKKSNWPTTICGVVYEKSHNASVCQFSWVCDPTIPKINTDSPAWKHSIDLAIQLVASPFPLKDITEGATYFHARNVTPGWARQKVKITTIDNHIFYR